MTVATRHQRAIGRRAVLAAGTAAAAIAVGHPLRAQAKIPCRIGHSEGIGTPLTDAFDVWAKMLREKSGGRIDAQHFPASQLGSYTQNIEANRLGTIQVTTGGPDTEEKVAPEIAAAGGAPGFVYKDEAHVDRVLQGELGEMISQVARKKTGVEFVAYGEVGFRHLLTKRAATTLDMAKGLKIRVPELRVWVDFWKKLGLNPTPLPYAEQYSALSSGVIDGLEADFFSIKGFKWHEQAKFLTLSYHWFLPKAVRVNAAWLDALPADLRTMVRATAKEAFAEQRKVNRAKADDALKDLQTAGVTVAKLSAAESAKWFELTKSMFDDLRAVSPETKTVVDKILALRG